MKKRRTCNNFGYLEVLVCSFERYKGTILEESIFTNIKNNLTKDPLLQSNN